MMGRETIRTIISRILSGYAGVGKRILAACAVVVAAVIGGTAVVYPLWFFASRQPEFYSLFVLAVCAVLASLFFLRKLIRAYSRYRSPGRFLGSAVLPFLRKAALFLTALVLLYAVLLLFAWGLLIPGILGAAVYLLILGYLLYARTAGGREHTAR